MTGNEPGYPPRDRFVTDYLRDGFFAPLTVIEPARVDGVVAAIREVLETAGLAPEPTAEQASGRLASMVADSPRSPVPFMESRHLDSRLVYDICVDPVVIESARTILGDDLLLWRSTFIRKQSGGPEFRWHQDYGGVFGPDQPYGLQPPVHLSVWIALTRTTAANGCLRFMPGIGHVLPSAPSGPGKFATLLTREEFVDESRAVDVPLEPGQAVIFSDRALHASWPNSTGEDRLALAVRLTIPQVRVRPHFRGHRCILVHGRDALGANLLASPPHEP